MKGDLQRRLEDLEARRAHMDFVFLYFDDLAGETEETAVRKYENEHGVSLAGREVTFAPMSTCVSSGPYVKRL